MGNALTQGRKSGRSISAPEFFNNIFSKTKRGKGEELEYLPN